MENANTTLTTTNKTSKGKTMNISPITANAIINQPKRKMTKKEAAIQQQLHNAMNQSIIEEYAERIKSAMEKDTMLKNNSLDMRKERVMYYIEIGIDLKSAKGELSTNDFMKLSKSINVTHRTVDRYIELVADKRITEITLQNLKVMPNPSKTKLLKMRDLSDTDFKKVLDGDDQPYKNLLKKIDTEKYKVMKSPHKNISNDLYKTFQKEGLDYALEMMDEMITELKQSEKKYKSELATLKPKSVNKPYTKKQKDVA